MTSPAITSHCTPTYLVLRQWAGLSKIAERSYVLCPSLRILKYRFCVPFQQVKQISFAVMIEDHGN